MRGSATVTYTWVRGVKRPAPTCRKIRPCSKSSRAKLLAAGPQSLAAVDGSDARRMMPTVAEPAERVRDRKSLSLEANWLHVASAVAWQIEPLRDIDARIAVV